jgi:A/G-specific adenine glycosylase
MLQQTQVDRVRPYYERFLERFPNVEALAAAPLGDVLALWQGLGYNRRARMLHEAAKALVQNHKGIVPKDIRELEALPGIGAYTARAVAAFAHNEDVVFVETNLRTAVMHEFFGTREKVSDAEIIEILAKALPKGESRKWYAALMDYGAHLKRSGVRINAKSKGYTKQKAFKGSAREVRGAILKALIRGKRTRAAIEGIMGDDRKEEVRTQLARLAGEGLLTIHGTRISLPR